MQTKRIALLCDYGLDDAVATLYLLRHADLFERIDILPIAGNFPLDVSQNNAKRILSYCECPTDRVRLVDTSSIAQNEERLPEIHGEDGIGDLLPSEFECTVPCLAYDEWLASVDERYTVVSLGPCTVLLDLLKTKGAHELLMMGGNVAEPPNYKGYEFNHGMDTDAFQASVHYTHLIATLDSCHCPQCDFYSIELEGDELFERMARRAVELSERRGEKACYIYDLVAAVCLLHPEKFTVEPAVDKDGNALSMLRYIAQEPLI